jgi:pyocin large subunit-like protein
MSIQALAWAFKQEIRPAALKFVLVALSDCANEKEDMNLWPSIAHICDVTCLDVKTVKRYLVELKRLDLLVDTGRRKGRTNQIKVYKLNFENRPENGPVKQAHISHETGPKTDHGTLIAEPL